MECLLWVGRWVDGSSCSSGRSQQSRFYCLELIKHKWNEDKAENKHTSVQQWQAGDRGVTESWTVRCTDRISLRGICWSYVQSASKGGLIPLYPPLCFHPRGQQMPPAQKA